MSGFVDFKSVVEESYILYSILLGKEPAERLLRDPQVEPHLDWKIWVITGSLVEERIINLAVKYRMIEDRFLSKNLTPTYPYQPSAVCHFVSGAPTTADLAKSGLRLACDKIVHATKVSYYEDGRYDFITIEGERSGKPWRVKIDVLRMVAAGMYLATQYENNWEVNQHSQGRKAVFTVDEDGVPHVHFEDQP